MTSIDKSTLPLKLENRPLYYRAIEVLEDFIERGVSSQKVEARQLGISRSTLREAVGNLESAGVIVRRQAWALLPAPRPGGVSTVGWNNWKVCAPWPQRRVWVGNGEHG